jgi:dienelactone hydrolase
MEKRSNVVIDGSRKRSILLDVAFDTSGREQPVVIFSHGYKGYKDWGAWHLVEEAFVKAGFVFVKFNFSYNGGTVEDPIDFPDLEAFGNNNYSTELNDLGIVLDWIQKSGNLPEGVVNTNELYLIGHSRGGGISILRAGEDERVRRIATWASVCDYETRFPTGEELKAWKEDGVAYVHNGRTKQNMPLYFQLFEDFQANKERLNIKNAASRITVPFLIVHGTDDQSVLIREGELLQQWNPAAAFLKVDDGQHTFGSKQPYEEKELPADLQLVTDRTIAFFEQ